MIKLFKHAPGMLLLSEQGCQCLCQMQNAGMQTTCIRRPCHIQINPGYAAAAAGPSWAAAVQLAWLQRCCYCWLVLLAVLATALQEQEQAQPPLA
jgi:hypothetical protein